MTGRKQALIAGMTDYTGVSMDVILSHFRDWRDNTATSIEELRRLRGKVEEHQDRIDEPNDVLGFIDYFLDLFARYSGDFERLLTELPRGVGDAHVQIVRQIYDSASREDRLCVRFNGEHIGHGLKDEALRWLIDNIYAVTRDTLIDFKDLSNLVPRLRTFVGTTHGDRPFAVMAIEEAQRSVPEDERPHPKVGAVVVKDGRVLSKAHRGEDLKSHAEYIALEKKLPDDLVAGATIYTTLEPCTTRNHPKIPCAERLIERKIGRVVIGMLDPDSRISGKGVQKLRSANIITDFFPHDLMAQVEELNREFTRKCHADNNAAQAVSQIAEPSQVRRRLTEESRKEMIAALKPFAASGRLIDLVKYTNDSQVADLAYQLSAVLRDAGWKPTEYVRTSYEPISGLLIEIDAKNPPTRAAAAALLSALSAGGLSVAGPVSSLPGNIGFTVPQGAGAAIRLTVGAIVSR